MNQFIYCHFLKKKLEKQQFQPYPNEIGKYIYNNISKKAWNKWLEKQTILINERKLNMLKIKDRKIIEKEMINFFFGDKKIKI